MIMIYVYFTLYNDSTNFLDTENRYHIFKRLILIKNV